MIMPAQKVIKSGECPYCHAALTRYSPNGIDIIFECPVHGKYEAYMWTPAADAYTTIRRGLTWNNLVVR